MRASSALVHLLLLAALADLAGACCTSAPATEPVPATAPVEGEPRAESDRDTTGTPGEAEVAEGAEGEDVGPGAAPHDYWFETFCDRMPLELRRRYLKTPEAERYERFGAYFTELQLREDMLAPHRDQLSREDIAAYWRLDGVAASRRFLKERREP